jgi:predicted flap endonuclease-1-like 5' DNA nuclease
MWGVGPAAKARLDERGIHTISQLADVTGALAERPRLRPILDM